MIVPLTPVIGHVTPPSSYFLRGLTIRFTKRTIDAGMRYELADDFSMATLSTAGAAPVARFQLLNEEDLAALLDQADSKNTKRQIKYAVSIFEEYCSTSGDEIEKLTDAELDDLLSRFYGGARNKSGELYTARKQCKQFAMVFKGILKVHAKLTLSKATISKALTRSSKLSLKSSRRMEKEK